MVFLTKKSPQNFLCMKLFCYLKSYKKDFIITEKIGIFLSHIYVRFRSACSYVLKVAIRVLLIFQTSRYLSGLLTLIVVLFESSKNGFRIFLSITETRPGHFEVSGFTVVKSKN